MPSRGHQAVRYVAELVVIFVGVSLSFAAENIREARSDRLLERQSIERLNRDMDQDLADFPVNVRTLERGIEAINWLQAAQDGPTPPADSVAHYLRQYLFCAVMRANAAEYESLKWSGGLNRISDTEFRQLLALNYQDYSMMADLHLQDCNRGAEIVALVAEEVRLEVGEGGWRATVVGDPRSIVQNRRFQNALASHEALRGYVVSMLVQSLERLEELKRQAQASLDR